MRLKKKATPNLTLVLYLRTAMNSYSSSQATRAHEIEATLLMGCVRALGAPDTSAAVGSQKRFTTCFRVLKVASRRRQQNKKNRVR